MKKEERESTQRVVRNKNTRPNCGYVRRNVFPNFNISAKEEIRELMEDLSQEIEGIKKQKRTLVRNKTCILAKSTHDRANNAPKIIGSSLISTLKSK